MEKPQLCESLAPELCVVVCESYCGVVADVVVDDDSLELLNLALVVSAV